MPTLREILKEQIAALGGDGLCKSGLECGCDLDDLAPCSCLVSDMDIDECKPAKKGEDGLYHVIVDMMDQSIANGIAWLEGLLEVKSIRPDAAEKCKEILDVIEAIRGRAKCVEKLKAFLKNIAERDPCLGASYCAFCGADDDATHNAGCIWEEAREQLHAEGLI